MTKTVTVDAVDKSAAREADEFNGKPLGNAPLDAFVGLARFADSLTAKDAATLDPSLAGLIGMGESLVWGVNRRASEAGKPVAFSYVSAMEVAVKLAVFVMRQPLNRRDECLWQLRGRRR